MIHAQTALRDSTVFARFDGIARDALRMAIWKAAGRRYGPLAGDTIGAFSMGFAVRAAHRGSKNRRSFTAPQRDELLAIATSLADEAGIYGSID